MLFSHGKHLTPCTISSFTKLKWIKKNTDRKNLGKVNIFRISCVLLVRILFRKCKDKTYIKVNRQLILELNLLGWKTTNTSTDINQCCSAVLTVHNNFLCNNSHKSFVNLYVSHQTQHCQTWTKATEKRQMITVVFVLCWSSRLQ